MRKFTFINAMALVAGLFVSNSFAQPRDLFAEFEAEETAAEQAKADSVKAAEAKAAAEKKAAEEKAAAEKAEAERLAAEKKAAEEKKLAEEKAAADKKAAEEKAAAEQKAEEKRQEEMYRAAAEEKRRNMEMAAQQAQAAAADSAKSVDDPAAVASENKYGNMEEAYNAAMQEYAEKARIQEDLDAIARDSAAVAQMIADSVAAAEKAKADSIAAATSSSSVAVASSSSMSRRDLLGPVKVSKVNGIDEMKGRYKSPRKALFMSLVIPGSGQMYVGGSNFTYARGGVYLALEAALWSGWYYFSVYKYNDQMKKYKKFAKNHYSIGRYESKMRDLYHQDAVNYADEFRSRYLGTRETFCDGIYDKANERGCYSKDKLYANDDQFKDDFVRNPVSLGDEMDNVKFDDASAVYQLLSDNAYVLGWDDVTDETVATNLGLKDPNSATEVLGSSDNMKKYRSLRSKANDYADMQAWFFGGLILNHIVSAVDAALSASSFNKTLYQEDLSWYDHLHFDSGIQLFNGFGVNVQASWGF
ncbi:DUF5683 domain-containing protein [Fibrobacter sp. UWEL]|uniref:DUF5683 domain-containing protein n=1 Tax=Fibrobacter sp. UWEL TaxID=1896209 RepID=UPI0009179F01|nr:DUF5683 domain-containing protein [Fibrobacter sp. UWEL]SHK60945.1 hypothetical protein SAMN05720468_10440 [Fibrobacter sp. UWEL]